MVDSGTSRFCGTCGSELPGDARFCAHCGATLATSASDVPRWRTWLVVVAVVGVALVVPVVGYGLSREGADAPVAAPIEASESATSAGPSDVAETIPDPIEPVRPVTSTRIVASFPFAGAVLSPDGRLIFYQMPDDRRPEGRMFPWCVQDVETSAESCADIPIGLGDAGTPVWSRASDRIVWTTVNNNDVFVYDVPTNTVANLTDDGIDAELMAENIGKGLTDINPTWVSGDEEIAFFRPYSQESLFRLDLYSVDLEGNEAAFVESPTYEHTFQGNVSLRPRWEPRRYPPLPDRDREVLVAGDGAIFSVDLGRGTTSVVVEYAAQYEEEIRGVGEALGLSIRPSLWPIAHLGSGRLLLADPLVSTAMNQAGDPADATSGAYVLDIASGSLSPLFRRSPDGEYGGPITVALSPDGSELLVVWFDAALVHPFLDMRGQEGAYAVSVLDVDGIDAPIDPRDLPQIYGLGTDPSLWLSVGFSVEWAANDTVLLNTQSDEGTGSVLIELNRG